MEGKQEEKIGIRKWWIKNLIFIGLAGTLLFLTSGKINWVMAWSYLGAAFLIVIANAIAMDPTLLIERSELQEGTKKWDISLATFVAIIGPLSLLIVAGLDIRFGWSQLSRSLLQILALAIFVLGAFLGTWAMAANKFFSSTVRIQEERQHQVVTGGPYQYVRHPGYGGAIISILATPVALGSWFGLLPGALVAIGYILRTALEDRLLLEELDGYKNYAEKVRCRLFPMIW